ncbi:phosphohistidine phosphatase, SixA [Noviherbaspirillum humi]|uniref:Phosphohistidine phosphatase, SixA n=1 Tax=Noviherbaspirillum humi TaxID=1688639 RepID=A0A239LBT1_9BURK|nr:histidine phosphatase family protein [Noviherbaspirillum humi]SNT27765.1 phosphohistidine phosphatase, SixA [Noviherbaspirillum humi]
MDLILWRHAHAAPGMPDSERPLTKKGRQQAEKMAAWIKPLLPKEVRILASPFRRAQETVQALGMAFETVDSLAQGRSPQSILTSVNWPAGAGTVMVVGHNPALGQIAALLLANTEEEWPMKKGGIWWFTHDEETQQAVLVAAMSPGLL